MIRVTNLTKHYGPRTAVDQLNFSIEKGEIVGFLGPNGAGKSTTMKMITAFMPATSGSAEVAGFDVFKNAIDVKRNIGFLPENPPVYLEMTVRDYLDFAARIHGMSPQVARPAVDRVIEKTSLGDVRGRLIGNLSKGYRQRVGLAQALVHNPPVLVLDEPTVGLDPKQIIEIRTLIKSLAGDHTVILSSHILPEVTATCQRIIVINKGRIVAEDSIEHLTARMKRGLSYSLVVKSPHASVIEAIKRIQGVDAVTDQGGGRIAIAFNKAAGDVRDQVIEAAVQGKMGVLEFSPDRVSLEDVFLELTTEEPSSHDGSQAS